MEWTNVLLTPVLMLSMTACSSDTEPGAPPVAVPAAGQEADRMQQAQDPAPYAFDAPEASLPLADELEEISGLTVLADGRLGAVQDEDGIFYILNPETGAVEARHPFGDSGDYEGVELAGDRLFVLKSNGTLIELTGWEHSEAQAHEFETHLKGENDTEGLAYDPSGNRLLIITKEEPGGDLDDDFKAIYGFDLTANALSEEPVFTIDTQALESQITGNGKFKPSALAVHPTDGHVYVISSVARAVIRLNSAGEVADVWNLPEETFEQPEGIAFLPDGDVMISSEGGDGPGMLHRIAPQSGS